MSARWIGAPILLALLSLGSIAARLAAEGGSPASPLLLVGPETLTDDEIRACATRDGRAPSHYWVDGTFSEHVRTDELHLTWYSRQLCAMSELPFARTAVGTRTSLRLLWLPTFSRPIGVRVFETRDGSRRLVATQLKGKGGYAPGEIDKRVERSLTEPEWSRLQGVLRRTDPWSLPTENDTLGCDGTTWILEAFDGTRYHVVDRWDGGEIRELGRLLLDLSGLDYDPLDAEDWD